MSTDSHDTIEVIFSGRQRELAELQEHLQDCLKGIGRTIFIEGEAGIGKTRLVDELTKRAKDLGFTILKGQCFHGTTTPYLPFEDALKDFFKISRMEKEERRLAAVMFTDMVGYTALTQRNENKALQLLRRQNEILESAFRTHGGKVIKTIGDAFLVEFSSALEAFKCAVDAQKALSSYNSQSKEDAIRVRIGIHLGDVVERQGDVFGDAVNIASRIEPLADPGGLCVTQQVFDQVVNKVPQHMERIEPRRLKNVDTDIGIYKVPLIETTKAGAQEEERGGTPISSNDRELELGRLLTGSSPALQQGYAIDLARAESLKERFLQTVTSLIVDIARREPILLFLDDLHWADASSLALLHMISATSRESKALILGAYRPEELTGKEEPSMLTEELQVMSREDLFVKIKLEPLGRGDYARILLGAFQTEFSSEFVSRLYDETEGNPLFAVETLRLLVQEGVLKRSDGKWELGLPISRIRIPERVRDVILRRVAMVGEEDRNILEFASVIGEQFESATIQEVLGINRLSLLRSLASIEKSHSLIQSVEGGYKFTHSKVREVAYDELIPELRREYHVLVADWIEGRYSNVAKPDEVVPVLAHHFYEGRQWDKALTYFALAGDMAMQIHAHREALEAYRNAFEASKLVTSAIPLEISSSLLERKALAALASGEIETALNTFDLMGELAANASDIKSLAKAKFLHGWANFWSRDLDKALEDSAETGALGRQIGDRSLEARSHYLTGTILLTKGSREEAKEHLKQSLTLSREAGDKIAETQTLLVLLMEGFTN